MNLPRLWCWATDHAFSIPDTASPPRCSRCEWDGYWPVRMTAGGIFERAQSYLRAWWWWWKRRGDDIPF